VGGRRLWHASEELMMTDPLLVAAYLRSNV
jgi:hypothetical protein